MKLSNSHEHHTKKYISPIKIAIITISDSRFKNSNQISLSTSSFDESGDIIKKMSKNARHEVTLYTVLPDSKLRIQSMINHIIQEKLANVILTTGGTGISTSDVTIEAIENILDKKIDGFGELFRITSYQNLNQHKYSSMISRASAGVKKNVLIFMFPGSPQAVKTAMNIILPELSHMVYLITS